MDYTQYVEVQVGLSHSSVQTTRGLGLRVYRVIGFTGFTGFRVYRVIGFIGFRV